MGWHIMCAVSRNRENARLVGSLCRKAPVPPSEVQRANTNSSELVAALFGLPLSSPALIPRCVRSAANVDLPCA